MQHENETSFAIGPLLPLADVARELNVTVATVRREIARGHLAAVRVGERKILVQRADLLAYLAERPVA
jgi:excisionase family DNA binding protein